MFSPFDLQFKIQGKQFDSVEELLHFSETLPKDVSQFLQNWFDSSDTITVKTSGSTGAPKLISLKKEQMIESAKATGLFFDLQKDTKALLNLSADYIAGKMMLVRTMVLGWHLTIVSPESNPLKNLSETFDFGAMVPLQLHESLNEISQIKKIIIGGGAVSPELQKKIQNVSSEIYATYGMTETITHIAAKKLNHIQTKEDSYYQILPNISISKDERDCLVIDASKISDEKVITNDLVNIIDEKHFEWLGRFDSVINSGGIKLIPEQIEAKLSEIIESRFFVSGILDEKLGEKLVLIIEGKKTEKLESEILNKIKSSDSLNKFEKPKEIYFIEKFVETETKKIQRKRTLDLGNI
ncbi:AMP-binding protein [Aureivirga sp. CE67]|uniref:AMP-binding protein n=1 Tax=Aureivirga sp. CE67 TaxID=1788983 RepID=UPI0018C9B0B7|nr:AMP-binding protein [Aureivirga sp. CE67]